MGCGPPAVVLNASAAPGHETISVTWSDPSNTNLNSVLVYRGLWHDGSFNSAYPGYGQLTGNTVPTQFASVALYATSPEWELVGAVDPGQGIFVDRISTRGIYSYQIFAVDHATNCSPPLVESPVATNYILGDVATPYDGIVDVADLSMLEDSYGVGCGHQYYYDEVDIGPTSDGSGQGIPNPDCLVGFEDLMIFSFNFGNSSPQKATSVGSEELVLSWVKRSEQEWSCALSKPYPGLKGLHLVAVGPGMQGAQVDRGTLLSEQSGQVFLQKADTGNLDIGLAVLGNGLGIEGVGELFRVTLTAPLATFSPAIEARNTLNDIMEFQLLDHDVATIPTRHALGHNFPNPFNPATTIDFEIMEPCRVNVAVYSLDGRRVVVLVDDFLTAGSFTATWNGRDQGGRLAASGTYLYRLEAGDYTATKRMTMLK